MNQARTPAGPQFNPAIISQPAPSVVPGAIPNAAPNVQAVSGLVPPVQVPGTQAGATPTVAAQPTPQIQTVQAPIQFQQQPQLVPPPITVVQPQAQYQPPVAPNLTQTPQIPAPATSQGLALAPAAPPVQITQQPPIQNNQNIIQ